MPFPNKDTQFQPGQSGNPAGRPSRKRLTDALIKLIEEKDLAGPLMQVGMKAALKGDFRFWKELFDRVDGKVMDKLKVEGTEIVVDRRDRTKRAARKPPREPGAGEGPGPAV